MIFTKSASLITDAASARTNSQRELLRRSSTRRVPSDEQLQQQNGEAAVGCGGKKERIQVHPCGNPSTHTVQAMQPVTSSEAVTRSNPGAANVTRKKESTVKKCMTFK